LGLPTKVLVRAFHGFTTYTRARTAADRAAADLMGSIYDT